MSKSSFSWLALLFLAVSACMVLPSRGQNRGQNQEQVQLPDGDGEATVQAACAVCHSMNQVTNAGHDREEWTTVLHMMVNVGAPVPEDQFDTVVNYLSKNFPPKPQPPAQIIPGNVEVSIKEWVVPTPGSRPHDPMFAPDGTVWYSGQMANVLGHFDPKTEQFKEYKLPPKSGPHGLTPDKEGNIWYTANFAAYVGKLDPKTGEVTKYPMPDPKGRDRPPRRPASVLPRRACLSWPPVSSAEWPRRDLVGPRAPRHMRCGHRAAGRALRVPPGF